MRGEKGGEPRIIVAADADAVADLAVERIAAVLRHAVTARGRADWATTGGSASPGVYERLAAPPYRDELPWDDIHVWWGDDRFVRRGDEQSNVTAADEKLLRGGATVPDSNVHPVPVDAALDGGRDATWAANAYERELRSAGLPEQDGFPVLDVILVGVGPDGHLLSVFPGSPALDDEASWVLPIPAPNHVEPHVERVTLNPRLLDVARDVLVISFGGSKADVLGRVFRDAHDPHRLPAQLVRRPGVTWLLDEAAAAGLPAHAQRA